MGREKKLCILARNRAQLHPRSSIIIIFFLPKEKKHHKERTTDNIDRIPADSRHIEYSAQQLIASTHSEALGIISSLLKILIAGETDFSKFTMEQSEISSSNVEKNATSTNTEKRPVKNEKKKIATCREYGGDKEGLIYKSGIPALRASAHRVKFKIKHRKHDPKPVDRNGNETGTTWIPEELQEEQVFSYDRKLYDLNGAVINMLRGCDPDIVGSFEKSQTDQNASELDEPTFRLEDFRVPVSSVWQPAELLRREEPSR